MLIKNKILINVKALLPKDKEILHILKYCNYFPTDNWKIWSDSLGNSIDLNNFHITIKQVENYSDLFYKSSLSVLLEKTKLLLIGTCEDKYYLWLFDNEKIRFLYYDKQWKNLSPLVGGLSPLRILIQNLSIETSKEIDFKININSIKLEIKGLVSKWPNTDIFQYYKLLEV